MNNSFGPNYRTTARDRANRWLGLPVSTPVDTERFATEAGPSGARASTHQFPLLQPTSAPAPAPSGAPLLLLTDNAANNNHTAPSPHSSSTEHTSLMDLDNDILEGYATIDRTGVRFGENIYMQNHPHISVHPQSSNNLPPLRRQFYEPNLIGATGHSTIRNTVAMRPDQQLGHLQLARMSNELSKTNRMVVLELIKPLKPITGANEKELVEFLKFLKPIFSIDYDSSEEIIKLLLPKVQGQMFNLWMRAIGANANWDQLHSEILNTFFSNLRLRELQLSVIQRPQAHSEQFLDYVEDTISAAFALKVQLTENDVIESILSRCLPETKQHFMFSNKPQSIEELRSFASRVSNSIQSDLRWFGQPNTQPTYPQHPGNISQSRTHPPNPNGQRLPHTQQGRPNIICHRCGNRGHIAKHCRAHLN